MKKKKALMIVLAVLALGLAGLMLSGCDGDKELAAPTGLEITNDVLGWKAIEGADGDLEGCGGSRRLHGGNQRRRVQNAKQQSGFV